MFHKKNSYRISDASDSANSSKHISESISKLGDESASINCSINYKQFLGLFYTAISSVFITLLSIFVKQLLYISPGQLSMVRNIGLWTGCLPIAVYSEKEVFGKQKDRPMLLVTGLLVATALYLKLTAYRYLPLPEAAILMATTPTATAVMARIYLKEPCGLVQGLALMITVLGVILSVRLPELLNKTENSELDSDYIFGIASAIGYVLISSFSFVMLRKMKHIHFSVIIVYTGFIGMLENGVINVTCSYFASPRCGWDQILVLLTGIFGFVGQCALYLAIQMEAVGIVTAMKTSMDIIHAIVFQILFFEASPDIYDLSGACLVTVSVCVIGLQKWIVALPDESVTRKNLKCLLL